MVARKYDDLVPAWKEEYEAGSNIYQIGLRYSVRGQTVWGKLRQAGTVLRSRAVASREYALRADAFSGDLCRDASYWLGLLYADGSLVHKNGSFCISLVAHSDDIESVTGFAEFLETDRPIQRRADKKAVTIVITSKQLGGDLLRLGITQNKSHTIRFPSFLSDENRRHFVRGFFDGDGCVASRIPPRYVNPQLMVSITTNHGMASDIADVICSSTGISPTCVQKLNAGRSSAIRYEGRKRLLKIADYFYGDEGPFLSRKRRTFALIYDPAQIATGGKDSA